MRVGCHYITFGSRFSVSQSFNAIRHDTSRPILQTRQQLSTTGAIKVDNQRWREGPVALHIHAANKMFKRCQVFFIVPEKLGMLKLYRGDDRQPRMIMPEIVTELVRLVDKVGALANAIVDAEARHNRAD